MHMISKFAAASAALAISAAPALALSAWTGLGVVQTVTTACKYGGPKVNSRLTITYAPGNVNAESHLAFVARPKAFHLYKNGSDFAAGDTIGQVLVVKSNLDVVGIFDQAPPVKFVSFVSTPALPASGDPYIALTMKLTNFGGIKGCTVSLRSTLSRIAGT